MAAATKQANATPDDVMAAAAMKPLLALSKREPVNAAIGLTTDKLGVVFLHKKMKPRKVLSQLKAEAKKVQLGIDAPSLRFGTAEVDPEIDSSLVRFRINKEAPGMMAQKLRDHLKKAGFSKVEFIVDPALEEESEDDETGAEKAAEPDWPGLSVDLMGLAKQIAAAAAGDAGRQKVLAELAGVANAGLKARQDFAAASAAVQALREALAGGGESQSRAAKPALPVWQTAKDTVDDQLRALSDKLRKTGVATLAEVAKEVETLLEPLRVRLVGALMAYDSAPGKPETRAAVAAGVAAAAKWLASDERVEAVDKNPFGAAVSARATLGAALKQLHAELGSKTGAQS